LGIFSGTIAVFDDLRQEYVSEIEREVNNLYDIKIMNYELRIMN
jgi:hypothetical protein